MELECETDGIKQTLKGQMRWIYVDSIHGKDREINVLGMECPEIDLDVLLQQDWIKIFVSVEIVEVYDPNFLKIRMDKWNEYGIIMH